MLNSTPLVASSVGLRALYLEYIRRGFDADKDRLEQEIERWRAQLEPRNNMFGYISPSWPLALAGVAAFLYERDRQPALARLARDILLRYREWTSLVPADVIAARPEYEDGVPPLDAMFQPIMFMPACARIRDQVSDADWSALAQVVADSLRVVRHLPEWGAHNRAMLRAANLALAARVFADHPDAGWWLEMADELAEASWGRWSIEDAMLYQPIWMRASIAYAEARGRDDLRTHVTFHAHLRAMAQMVTPLGTLPDFGDSHWMSNQLEWLACFEWGAAAHRDPCLSWAARRLWQAVAEQSPTLGMAFPLMLAWQWCDESVPAQPPGPIPDALDDLVARKIVFRAGCGERDTYACLNYRDEGDYGRIDRDFLRATLPVSAEKMHHGHSDENSFVMLVSDGAVLLHDGGYRESPPDGIYRADIYHNRLIWRDGQWAGSSGLMDFIRDNGHYHPVRTERLYWTRLGDAEISRTRVHDDARSLLWDRTVWFFPGLDCFVVIDSACALRAGPRTLAALWWTTDILDRGATWCDTHISEIQGWRNRDHRALWVAFPQPAPGSHAFHMVIERARRCFQQEQMIAGVQSGDMLPGAWVNLVSVLWAHPRDTKPAPNIVVLDAQPANRGVAVSLEWQGETRTLAVLNDLKAGLVPDDVRPRYRAELGLARYGRIESDAHLVYMRQRGEAQWAGFINGTLLRVDEADLYRGKPYTMLQEDRSMQPGVPARFRWQSGAGW